MKYFVAGATARTAADVAGIHCNTATRLFRRLFERIALKQHQRGEQFGGASKGKRGRGQAARWLCSVF